jgi:glycosyltransferase involved in cell wall biosynthesis
VRIALIGPAYPDHGAAARHTTELAYRLAAAGHNVVIESWRAPGAAGGDGEEYPRTYRRLAWYRPDGWIAAGRRLRSADLVVFALPSQAQVPSYLSVLTALALGPDRPRTALICHLAPPDDRLTRILLARADTVIVHSAAQAAQARALAPEVPIVIARMPPHLPPVPAGVRPPDPGLYWSAYLHALGATPA